MQVERYSEKWADDWNRLVGESCNGTFLFHRDYMDYHKDRLTDCSLMFSHKGKWVGLLPASLHQDEIRSHGGLTYGGLLWRAETHFEAVESMYKEAVEYYSKELKAVRLLYKTIPYIYSSYPAQDDLYILFQNNAQLKARGLSSAILLADSLPFSQLRKRHVRKALDAGLQVDRTESPENWQSFWQILTNVLQRCHSVQPVHSLDEILYLKSYFPKEIVLQTVTGHGHVVAGCVLYLTKQTVHVQYISANEEGRALGALDLLFSQIVEQYRKEYVYLDFGISTEQGGDVLNHGLLFQKEGFGGRSVCYDQYVIQL